MRVWLFIFALVLASCGGGGGGGGSGGGSTSNSGGVRVTPPPTVAASQTVAMRFTDGEVDYADSTIDIAKLFTRSNLGSEESECTPAEAMLQYRQDAESLGATGIDPDTNEAAIIGIIDFLGTQYTQANSQNVEVAMERIFGNDLFAPNPNGFEPKTDTKTGGDPLTNHAVYVMLSALTLAPDAQIYFQNNYPAPSGCGDEGSCRVDEIIQYLNPEGGEGTYAITNEMLNSDNRPDVINYSYGPTSPYSFQQHRFFQADRDGEGTPQVTYIDHKKEGDPGYEEYLREIAGIKDVPLEIDGEDKEYEDAYATEGIDTIKANPQVQEFIDLFVQGGAPAGGNPDNRTIFVHAAGNRGSSEKKEEQTVLGVEDVDVRVVSYYDANILYGGLPLIDNRLEELWLVVTGWSPKHLNADFQRCGASADWCLVAPFATYANSGTSFAAPTVAAAFALAKQKFRGELSNVQIRQRILATADKKIILKSHIHGADADDARQAIDDLTNAEVATQWTDENQAERYGHGYLSVKNLLQPVGDASMPARGGRTYLRGQTGLTSAALLGDGIKQGFAGYEYAAMDELGAPFWYPLASLVHTKTSSDLVTRFFQNGGFAQPFSVGSTGGGGSTRGYSYHQAGSVMWQGGWGIAHNQDPSLLMGFYGNGTLKPSQFVSQSAFTNPFVSLAPQRDHSPKNLNTFATSYDFGTTKAMGFHRASDNGTKAGASGFVLEHSFGENTQLQAGITSEETRQLGGLLGSGAFATNKGATTYFFGINRQWQLSDGVSLLASGIGGVSEMAESPLMWFEDSVISSAFSLGVMGGARESATRSTRATTQNNRGWAVAVTQPLRAEVADATLGYATGLKADGITPEMVTHKTSVEPSGREITAEIRGWMPLGGDTLGNGTLGSSILANSILEGGTLDAAFLVRTQPDHIRTAATRYEYLLSFSKRF